MWINIKKYTIESSRLTFENIEEALMHILNFRQLVGAELLDCKEMWIMSTKKASTSLKSCYHFVVIVAVKKHDGEWIAVCKLSNGTNIGDHGYLYVSLRVGYICSSWVLKVIKHIMCKTMWHVPNTSSQISHVQQSKQMYVYIKHLCYFFVF